MRTIILHEFSQEELLKFAKLYKQLEKEGLLPESIIAVTTNESLNKKMKDALDDIEEEHISFV